mmetsp:Transcript_32622/g.86286  ORF Transcript_32622/g.86286 Transcript_32622/m.86286 type:complete len:204 (-) Transcript_32622:410-1021(-)
MFFLMCWLRVTGGFLTCKVILFTKRSRKISSISSGLAEQPLTLQTKALGITWMPSLPHSSLWPLWKCTIGPSSNTRVTIKAPIGPDIQTSGLPTASPHSLNSNSTSVPSMPSSLAAASSLLRWTVNSASFSLCNTTVGKTSSFFGTTTLKARLSLRSPSSMVQYCGFDFPPPHSPMPHCNPSFQSPSYQMPRSVHSHLPSPCR